MNTMLELLFTLAVAGSVVTACILFLRKVPVHIFPAKWRYRLQKIAILLYLLPVAAGISWIFPLIDAHTTTTTVQNSTSITQAGFIPESFMSLRTIPASAALIFLSIWAIGAIGFAARQLYDYRRFTVALSRSRTDLPERGEAAVRLSFLKEELGLKSKVALAGSSIVRSPVLAGLRQPTIYFPQALASGVDLDMDMVLRHELMHLKRKDLWVKALALVVGALHWYNPLAHLLRKEIQLWSELSCDEEVVVGMSHAERKRYGSTLLNVVAGSGNLPTRFCASLSGDGKQLKRRLTLMLNVKKLKKKTMVLTVSAVFLIAAVSTTAAVWASDNTPTVVAQQEAAPAEALTATAAASGATVPGPVPTAAAEGEETASPASEPHATAAPAAAPTAVTQASEAPSDEVHAVPQATAAPTVAQAAKPVPQTAPADEVHAVPQATAAPAAAQAAKPVAKAVAVEPQAVAVSSEK
ncbi:M56 family metallopeptidase [Cohnella hashimotonis]|uniref:M56 family metallopeptidase n=1 Tax=Cohnella hashimotonis TaxID=2826895 RepID=A0ABT6TPW4_9BACL|nr:M56 family metallopeptidase [Cohnella hashimotonis]MDI4647949.1 M56 family metallopeptidase [Cohnella hashimotonis]